MKKRLLMSVAVALGFTMQGFALPADPTPRVVTQPDGSTLTIIMNGDEFGSYITTVDGHLVERSADGYFRYIDMKESVCAGTTMIARDSDRNDQVLMQQLEAIDREAIIKHSTQNMEVKRHKMYSHSQSDNNAMRKIARAKSNNDTAKVKGLVILAQFQDTKFNEKSTPEQFDELFNEEGNDYMGGIGSARDYFMDQSFGLFEPTFDVVGPVTLPENMAYYGTPEAGQAYGDNGSVVYMLPIHACDAAYEADLCDFSKYDCNDDGYVDLVFVVYAGYAESSGAPNTTVWPHAAWVKDINEAKERDYDGVKIDAYACTSELAGNSGSDMYGIGAICHEFSHTLGLPDWYDTQGMGGFGMNKWSVMDQGCHNAGGRIPCGYNAYEREFCGWMEITELTEACSIEMGDVATTREAYKVVAPNNEDRYFTFETRVQCKWDSLLPAEGMLIIKVDYSESAWDLQSNSINSSPSRQRFQFVPADNKIDTESFATDLWPYGNNDCFSNETTPAMKIHLTTIKDKPVSEIRFDAVNKVSSFNFMGGAASVESARNGHEAVYYNGSEIVINDNKAQEAQIYNLQGMLVATVKLVDGKATYRPLVKGVVVVRHGEKNTKVSI